MKMTLRKIKQYAVSLHQNTYFQTLLTFCFTFQIRSSDVVKSYISRIQAVQPLINAYVDERFQEAFEEAKQVDALISSGTELWKKWRKRPLFWVFLSQQRRQYLCRVSFARPLCSF
ncbi:hypothetical protein TNIN_165241 [Trichonephila inaurata madagascariensis]|uniref:Uncharacterized protein n=1 Tax=Trichonephila inaurata madagascariensis TaxID=2747483 RepID=A0A8X6X5W2_9ARAC|nr:hypothetical protein TNIN_165241 [Trichonephila inaurata madagascariensis]